MNSACTWEIMASPPEDKDIRSEYLRFLSLARERDWVELKVMFGFAWANNLYENDWLEEVMTPDELDSKVKAAETNDDGSIGKDDLFVTVLATGVEHTFCHENDIRLKGAVGDKSIATEAARFQEIKWEVYERTTKTGERAGKWSPIASEHET